MTDLQSNNPQQGTLMSPAENVASDRMIYTVYYHSIQVH